MEDTKNVEPPESRRQLDRLVRLFDCPHPYYCMNANAWFAETSDYHNRYENAADFLEKFGDSDADMNLVFRWDWGGLGDSSAGDDENPLPESRATVFHVWWIVQRKGFMVSGEFPVTADDEPKLREWLAMRWNKLVELWGPVSE